MCTMLLISQCLFIVGITQTADVRACRFVAVVLHYSLLSTFCWMLVEGYNIHDNLTALVEVCLRFHVFVCLFVLYCFCCFVFCFVFCFVLFCFCFVVVLYCFLYFIRRRSIHGHSSFFRHVQDLILFKHLLCLRIWSQPSLLLSRQAGGPVGTAMRVCAGSPHPATS